MVAGRLRDVDLPMVLSLHGQRSLTGRAVVSRGKPLRFASTDAPGFTFSHSLGLGLPSHHLCVQYY